MESAAAASARRSTRLRSVVATNDHEIDVATGLQILHGILIFGRAVTGDSRIVARELDHHVVLTRIADDLMKGTAPHQKFAAKVREGERIALAVLVVGSLIVDVEPRNPISLDHGRPQLLLEHDFFRKPVPTFRDHALERAVAISATI